VTDSEYPDPWGLPGKLDANSQPSLAQPSDVPGNSVASVVSTEPPGFASRRQAREAGAYRATEAAPAARTAVVRRPKTKSPSKRTRDVVRSDVAKPASRGLRHKLSTAGVMTVVAGLFASFTLPAAFADQGGLAEFAPLAEAQTLEVTATTTDASANIRDSYGVTNAADLRRMYAEAIRQQNLAAYMNSGARELGDDYPWPDQLHRGQGGGLSPLNYYYRECVDFVAWRLNRDAGATSAPFRWVWSNLAQGSAYSWKRAWESHGWPTGTTPEVGAVAWTPGGNHVAYVSGVLSDGSVVLEEYNYSVDHGYSQRIAPASSFYYLYAPPA
jgi:surface antigen